MEKFIKFKRLEKEGNKITVQIDSVKWGVYTDCRGNKVQVKRGNYERFYISKYFRVQSVNYPDLGFEFLFLQGEDKSSDIRLTSYEFFSEAEALEVFKALQSIAIDEEKIQPALPKDKQDALQKIKELKKEIKALKKELDKKPLTRWKAEKYRPYYYIASYKLSIKKGFEERDSVDVDRYSQGNYFKTEAEAEQHQENLKILQQIKDMALASWESLEEREKAIKEKDGFIFKSLAFKDNESREKAIKKIGEDRLKEFLNTF